MSVLVIAEHDNQSLKPATLNAVGAAAQLGRDPCLVAAAGAAAVDAAAKIAGVAKVWWLTAPPMKTPWRKMWRRWWFLAGGYSHVLAPATSNGKNIMPRVAALMDVMQISDIAAVVDADTFVRPIYAGNAMATVKSGEATKIITVRTTAFEAAAAGWRGQRRNVDGAGEQGLSQFVGAE